MARDAALWDCLDMIQLQNRRRYENHSKNF
jgi:hypothetical protein